MLDRALSEGQLSMGEHQHRIAAALKATTLGELEPLVRDLQADELRAGPDPGRPRKVLISRMVAGLVVLVALIGWGVSRMADPPTDPPAENIEQPEVATEDHAVLSPPVITIGPAIPTDDVPPTVLKLPRYLDTAEGMAGILEEIRKRFGNTMGYELAFRPDRAFLALPDPANDQRKLFYSYSGGWGNPSDSARSDTDDLVDLSAFDIGATVAAWQSAPATLQIAPDDVEDTYLDIDHIAEPDGPGALETLIRVTTKSGMNGFVYLDPAGAIKRVENPS